ncbi:MAG: hypothetical protein L0L99_07030, partial [Lacticaseibacillus paracasei]|nr:hypothetical protein [Lacticaseibacillus paracasei]
DHYQEFVIIVALDLKIEGILLIQNVLNQATFYMENSWKVCPFFHNKSYIFDVFEPSFFKRHLLIATLFAVC